MFQLFIKKIIDFVQSPLHPDNNLYPRKHLYLIILPILALAVFIAKKSFGFILGNIFGIDFIVSQYSFDNSYLGSLDNISWLVFSIKGSIKECFAYLFLLSRNPKHFFIGAIFMICFTIAELSLNANQASYVGFFGYMFRYLILFAICVVVVNFFSEKLKILFKKITPHFNYVVLISCLLYWVYYSIHFDPNQTSFVATMLLNLRLLASALIFAWIRMRYSFNDALLFSTLLNIASYNEFILILVNLFNVGKYKKDAIRNGLNNWITIFR